MSFFLNITFLLFILTLCISFAFCTPVLSTHPITCLYNSIIVNCQKIWNSNINKLNYFLFKPFLDLHISQKTYIFPLNVPFSLLFMFSIYLYLPSVAHVETPLIFLHILYRPWMFLSYKHKINFCPIYSQAGCSLHLLITRTPCFVNSREQQIILSSPLLTPTQSLAHGCCLYIMLR